MRRALAITCCALTAVLVGAATAQAAAPKPAKRAPTELWEAFPLQQQPTRTESRPRQQPTRTVRHDVAGVSEVRRRDLPPLPKAESGSSTPLLWTMLPLAFGVMLAAVAFVIVLPGILDRARPGFRTVGVLHHGRAAPGSVERLKATAERLKARPAAGAATAPAVAEPAVTEPPRLRPPPPAATRPAVTDPSDLPAETEPARKALAVLVEQLEQQGSRPAGKGEGFALELEKLASMATARPQAASPRQRLQSSPECRITWWRGYVTAQFQAVERRAGAETTIALSRTFRWRSSDPPAETEAAQQALAELVKKLEQQGWTFADRGDDWFALHLTRRAS